MKILAIRGKNLASIPYFEIDLASGPLRDTRIFAITGPTGAGKSTLLDAMCLSLYDRVPRLHGARDVQVGEVGVSALDPRSVMRRGTAEAYAEVDFTGQDGSRYRAIWEVWRARRKIGGRLQNQRMRLMALDGGKEASGATKTETLGLIEDKVGLSFSEFRRAVLLAQGDFASFLRARADERAALLERMTGTEIYARLSMAAFSKAREEEEKLGALEGERSRILVLSEEERSQQQQAFEAELANRERLEKAAVQARSALAWHVTHEQLMADLAEAEAALASAKKKCRGRRCSPKKSGTCTPRRNFEAAL